MRKGIGYGMVLIICGILMLVILHGILHANEWIIDLVSALCIIGGIGVIIETKRNRKIAV